MGSFLTVTGWRGYHRGIHALGKRSAFETARLPTSYNKAPLVSWSPHDHWITSARAATSLADQGQQTCGIQSRKFLVSSFASNRWKQPGNEPFSFDLEDTFDVNSLH